MFDILQPSSLVPWQNETQQPEPVYKPALVIPISAVIKIIPAGDPAPMDLDNVPFSKWKMPDQPGGYIKGGKWDFL